MNYTLAPDVRDIAQDLIVNYHQHLMNVRVEYLFMDKTPVSKGKATWGRMRKVTGLSAFLSTIPHEDKLMGFNYDIVDGGDICNQPFFVMEVSAEIWGQLDDKQRRALVDHELSHCWRDEDDQLVLLSHDIEEFAGVIKRHGLWRPDLEMFMEKSGQMALFGRE